jgi:hypothetical protein
MKNWKLLAFDALARAELNSSRPTKSELAKICGVSRWTLWRDREVRARYHEVVESKRQGSSKGNQKGSAQRICQLLQQNDELRRQNEALLQNFIVVSRRLMERGIDPVEILGALAPTETGDAWRASILDWIDQ